MQPKIITGNKHQDARGVLTFNNNFEMSSIKRVYTIQNIDLDFKRGWQGHKVEQRWFSAIAGSFTVKTIEIKDWKNLKKNLQAKEFLLQSENFDILHIPSGFITCIQALEIDSKLLLFADYDLNEIQDDYRFPCDYFI